MDEAVFLVHGIDVAGPRQQVLSWGYISRRVPISTTRFGGSP